MASGRLRALLHAQSAHATRNATAQQPLLRVAHPGECNTQQLAGGRDNPLADPRAEGWRQRRLLAMLDAHPEARYAALTDTQADPEVVLLILAIRGCAMCELRIPRGKWDGVLFLDLLEQHSGTIH